MSLLKALKFPLIKKKKPFKFLAEKFYTKVPASNNNLIHYLPVYNPHQYYFRKTTLLTLTFSGQYLRYLMNIFLSFSNFASES